MYMYSFYCININIKSFIKHMYTYKYQYAKQHQVTPKHRLPFLSVAPHGKLGHHCLDFEATGSPSWTNGTKKCMFFLQVRWKSPIPFWCHPFAGDKLMLNSGRVHVSGEKMANKNSKGKNDVVRKSEHPTKQHLGILITLPETKKSHLKRWG